MQSGARLFMLHPEKLIKMGSGVGGELYKAHQISMSSWLDSFHVQLSKPYETTKGIRTHDLGGRRGFNDQTKLRKVEDYILVVTNYNDLEKH